ncbi:MAG: RHS repeat-associated core domain-containing protein [Bacteroidales bacterium]|nr:RHS repeat-associated core domain-containing protein [Bacteroidales bacterium]
MREVTTMQQDYAISSERSDPSEDGIRWVFFDAFSSKSSDRKILPNTYEQSYSIDFWYRSFTGKERDEETGYGYFGARYMDYELMTSFISVDRYADKYPFISPYAYCAWNPVRIIDPTGDTLFALDRKSQLDIISLADIYRNRIRFDDRGVASIDYSGMSDDDIETMNSHPGVALIKDISDSPVKILYEATDLILCTNPDGSKIIGFMTNKPTRIYNLSRGGLDSNNDRPYLPREGYDGQVIISPNAKYYCDGLQAFRTEIIGHELAENYARTAFNCNYNPNINGNTTMEKLGAHQYANQRMQNPHEAYTIRYKPQSNPQYNIIAYEYMSQ